MDFQHHNKTTKLLKNKQNKPQTNGKQKPNQKKNHLLYTSSLWGTWHIPVSILTNAKAVLKCGEQKKNQLPRAYKARALLQIIFCGNLSCPVTTEGAKAHHLMVVGTGPSEYLLPAVLHPSVLLCIKSVLKSSERKRAVCTIILARKPYL